MTAGLFDVTGVRFDVRQRVEIAPRRDALGSQTPVGESFLRPSLPLFEVGAPEDDGGIFRYESLDLSQGFLGGPRLTAGHFQIEPDVKRPWLSGGESLRLLHQGERPIEISDLVRGLEKIMRQARRQEHRLQKARGALE